MCENQNDLEDLKKEAENISNLNINQLVERLNEIKRDEEKKEAKLTPKQTKFLYLKLCEYEGREFAYIFKNSTKPSELELQDDKLPEAYTRLNQDYGDVNLYLKIFLKINRKDRLPISKNGKLNKALKERLNDTRIVNMILKVKLNKKESARFMDILIKEFSSIDKFARL